MFKLARLVQKSTPATGKGDAAIYARQLVRHLQDAFSNGGVVDENTLRTFLREVEQLDKLARAGLDGQVAETALKRFAEVVRGVRMAGQYKSNAAAKNLAAARAAIAEIRSIAKHVDEGSTLKAVQPLIKDFPEADDLDYRMFREALFEGPGAGKGVDGEWFLEVKHYENFDVDRAVDKLKNQVNRHFDRLFDNGVEVVGAGPSNWKGLVYDFAEHDNNLDAFKGAIMEQTSRTLKEILGDESRDQVREYLLTRMKVNGATFDPASIDEMLDMVFGAS